MTALNLQNLLWSTRGKEWGFRFVHQPATSPVRWGEVYQGIFGSNERIPQRWHGRIVLEDGAVFSYVASRFYDSETKWRDAAGREIPHEMLLTVGASTVEEVSGRAWEQAVMDHVREYYRHEYSKDSSALQPFSVTTGELALSLTVAPLAAMRHDIQIGGQQTHANTPSTRGHAPLYEEIWRVLNMDLSVLITRVREYLRGSSAG